MGMSSMKRTQTIEKRRLATPVDPPHLNPMTNPNENPLLGLDLGECIPPEQLGNLLGPLHIVLEVLEMICSVLTTLWMNQKEQMIKDVAWKESTQTNLKEIDPRLDDS